MLAFRKAARLRGEHLPEAREPPLEPGARQKEACVMARYRKLGSIAHNLAHGYLSTLSRDEASGQHVAALLVQAAYAAREPRVSIDVLSRAVEPRAVETEPVRRSLPRLRHWLEYLCQAEGADLERIAGASIDLFFHFDQPGDPGEGLVYYECRVRIQDERGFIHEARVPEWWRYG